MQVTSTASPNVKNLLFSLLLMAYLALNGCSNDATSLASIRVVSDSECSEFMKQATLSEDIWSYKVVELNGEQVQISDACYLKIRQYQTTH